MRARASRGPAWARSYRDSRTLPHLSAPPRVAACSAQKRELQDKVQELERHHV